MPPIAQTYLFWRDPHSYLRGCHSRFGPTFTIEPVKSPPLIFACDAEEIAAILRAPAEVLHPGAGGAVIEPLVGARSFMIADEQQHLYVRRAVVSSLRQAEVRERRQMVEHMVQQHLAAWPRGTPFAVHPRLRALSLEVILRTIFGERDIAALHRTLLEMFDIAAGLALQEPPLRHLPGWRGSWRRFTTARALARQLLAQLLAEVRRDEACSLLSRLAGSRRPDGAAVSAEELQDNVMSLVLAGHETTAAQLAWALQLLAHNPAAQAKLTESIDRGQEDYLLATVQEVLRHRPVFVFAIPRAVIAPAQIGKRTYRPPVHLLACIHELHHDPRIYEDPEQFRPERFLGRSPPHAHWLPWGGGRRRCPGRHLAVLEMQTVLRTLLSSASVLPVSQKIERARWRSVIVTPKHGCRITLTDRPPGTPLPLNSSEAT